MDQRFITYQFAIEPCRVAVDTLAGTTTTLSQPGPIVYGEALPFTASVAPKRSGSAPTGTMRLEVNGTSNGQPVSVDGNGQAQLAPGQQLDPADTVEALYDGDNHYAPSRSGSVQPQIVPAHTRVDLIVSPANPVAGDDVVVLAHVVNTDTGVVPSGSGVGFSLNGRSVATMVPLNNGFAGIEFTNVVAGSYTIRGSYHELSIHQHFFDSQSDLSGNIPSKSTPPGPGPQPVPTTTATSPPVATSPPSPATSVVTPVTASDLRALITRTLGDLRHAGLAGAVKKPQELTVTMPGTLIEEIVAIGGRQAAAKPTVLAAGRHAFAVPGPGSLRLKLTSGGRRALRQHGALHVKLTARFVPQAGAPVSSTRSLTLPRR